MLLSNYRGKPFKINGYSGAIGVGYYCPKCNAAFPILDSNSIKWVWNKGKRIGKHCKCKTPIKMIYDDSQFYPTKHVGIFTKNS